MGGTYRSVRSSVRGSPATGRFRQKLIVGDRLREKKGRRRRGKEEKKKRGVPISMRHPRRRCVPSLPTDRQRPRAVAARGSQALFLLRGERSRRCRRHWRPIAARRSRVLFLPREEMERLPTWGERSRRLTLLLRKLFVLPRMYRKIGRLGLFLRGFIFGFETFFRWFDVLTLYWFYHKKPPLFATMFVAPWFVAVPTQPLGRSLPKLVSCQFFRCRGLDGGRGGWRFRHCWSGSDPSPSSFVVQSFFL
ncbi:hypothetical protein GW17_00004966 [Ensete ventricosum]|nr:hypothetical protein GW17_00004966 [Ensete ventricosum]RZR77931.1 hypothetical protein BHM03_00003140 [Ensete ventricosum]